MKIIVYTKTGCSWCAGVIDFLHEHKLPFEERDVFKNRTYFDEMLQKTNQQKTPTVDIDGVLLADTDRNAVETYLREKKGI